MRISDWSSDVCSSDLDDLVRASEAEGQLTGVRALMLYPLNALIASQEKRLTAWTKPLTGDVRFALYNGLMGTARKSNRDKAEHDVPHQVLYRETLDRKSTRLNSSH